MFAQIKNECKARVIVNVYLLREFSLYTTNVFFEHLSISDLLFHIPGLFGISTEHQKARRQPVQTVNCAQVFQIVFLGQNEDYCIVAVSTTGVNLN